MRSKDKLGRSEAKTLELYTKGFLTPQEIARERGLSASTIRDHLANLKKKGFLSMGRQQTDGVARMPSGVVNKYRLHGEEFNVQVLNGSPGYDRAYRAGTHLFLDGNRVRLYPRSLEVYSGQDFWGDTPMVAESEAGVYWLRFFAMLEHRLNVLLLKPGSPNIRRVKHHVAEVGNELAAQASRDRERLRVSGGVDGREWLLADASWGFRELETVHPQSASLDMEGVVMPFFNDLRDRASVVRLPSQVAAELDALRRLVFEIGSAVKVLAPQPPAPGELDRSLSDYYG